MRLSRFRKLAVLVLLLSPLWLIAQVTETAYTSGAGHVDAKMDAVSIGLNQSAATPNQYQALAAGTTIVSAGLTDNLDFQVGAQLFLRSKPEWEMLQQELSGLSGKMRPRDKHLRLFLTFNFLRTPNLEVHNFYKVDSFYLGP